MTKNAGRSLQNKARSAMIEYSLLRWESAVVISLTVLLAIFSFLYRASAVIPAWLWIVWLLVGVTCEALIIFTSLKDPETGKRVRAQILHETFEPESLNDKLLRQKIGKAFDYRSRIEAAIRQRDDRESLNEIAVQVDGWIETIYRIAQGLDRYQDERKMLDTDKNRVEERIRQLEKSLQVETDSKVKEQIRVTIERMKGQYDIIQRLERTMERANLQLEQTLSALGTIYSQIILIEAKDIDDVSARQLRQEITEEVTGLGYLLSAMDELYAPEKDN